MIQLSQSAVTEITRLKARHNNDRLLLRLAVQSSNCHTFAYVMQFDEVLQDEDQVHLCNGIQVIVDRESLKHIEGLIIDYSEDLMGGGFRFHNPNATQTCGCGNSFSTFSVQ